ncbi:MAG: hypothetical protein QM739_03990 [Propionivibrio sp.]
MSKSVRALFFVIVIMSLCGVAIGQSRIRAHPKRQHSDATTTIKVFIDEYGMPYQADVMYTSFIRWADEQALDEAMRQRYEPVYGQQGERMPGWRIVHFRTPIR